MQALLTDRGVGRLEKQYSQNLHKTRAFHNLADADLDKMKLLVIL